MKEPTEQETYEMITEWLEDYKSTDNPDKQAKIKALIVSKMLPVVKRIARTIARRSYDPIDDMVQAGSIGLLKAIDNYSKDVNDNFRIYAGCLIIGEMKHYLRDKLNAIRVPRHIQELTYRINSFIGTLTPEQLNELTSDYVAEALNVPKKDIDFAIQIDRRKSTIYLEDLFNNENDNLGYEDLISKDNYKETADLEDTKLIFKNVIKLLPEDSKELIELYYYKDMSQKEIADMFNLTKMQINRKMKKAFSLLYKLISESNFGEDDLLEEK